MTTETFEMALARDRTIPQILLIPWAITSQIFDLSFSLPSGYHERVIDVDQTPSEVSLGAPEGTPLREPPWKSPFD